MRLKSETKPDVLTALSSIADRALQRHGFQRKSGTLVYSRLHGQAKQEIEFSLQFSPSYEPSADVHIQPYMRIGIPSVSKVALDMLGGDAMLLGDASAAVVNQPVELAAPKAAMERWFGTDADDIAIKVAEAVRFIERWAVPLFDEISTPADLIRAYQTDDARLLKQQHWFVYPAAAAVVEGDLISAQTILDSKFKSPGLRSRFSAAFSHVSRLQGEIPGA